MFDLFSLVVLSAFSLSQAAANNTAPAASSSDVPACAANCMSIKITEAANWFGAGDVQSYCQHPEFLQAYNICLQDHCHGEELVAGKVAGEKTCQGVTPNGGAKNATAHPPLSGPAGAPENSTLTAPKNGTKLGNAPLAPNGAPTTGNSNLNGALPTTTTPLSNSTGNAANSTSRFSGATGSAAANASSQAGAASGISSSSAIMFTALSSCLMSLII